MKTTVLSDRTKTVKYRTVKLKVGKFTVTERYENGKLKAQEWSLEGGFQQIHKNAYEPNRLRFAYYEDNSFLESEHCVNMLSDAFADEVGKPTLIHDWDEFKGFDHVICIWVGMDGNIYQINKGAPVPMWRHKDYIGSFTSEHYKDLPELAKVLERFDFIRNVEIMDIPYYNGGGKGIEFDWKLPTKFMEYGTAGPLRGDVRRAVARFRKMGEDNIWASWGKAF